MSAASVTLTFDLRKPKSYSFVASGERHTCVISSSVLSSVKAKKEALRTLSDLGLRLSAPKVGPSCTVDENFLEIGHRVFV